MEDEDYMHIDKSILLPDSIPTLFGTGADMSIDYDGSQGNIRTDLVAASDLNIDCGTNKTVVLEQIVWDDLRILPGSFGRPGVSDPSLVAYNVNGGGVSTYLYEFGLDDIATFIVQLPHTYKPGESIFAHIHWTPGPRGNEENGATIGWKLDYSWANDNAAFPTMTTISLSDACDGTDHQHQKTADVEISGTGKLISSVLLMNIKRTDTGTDDTWAGTASGQLPMLIEVDIHYPIDTVGSRQRTAK
jgi:hypothetical protein